MKFSLYCSVVDIFGGHVQELFCSCPYFLDLVEIHLYRSLRSPGLLFFLIWGPFDLGVINSFGIS